MGLRRPATLPPRHPADAAGQLSFDRVDAVVGSPTTAIQAGDLNGDGRLDLVVSGGQTVIVLTGQGGGRFNVTWPGAAGENPVWRRGCSTPAQRAAIPWSYLTAGTRSRVVGSRGRG